MAACDLILAADCPIDGRLPLPPAPVPFSQKKNLNKFKSVRKWHAIPFSLKKKHF